MKITSTQDLKLSTVKMIIHGESGAGKTSLAKTIKEPTLIISSEAGLLCLQDANPPLDVVDITIDDEGKPLQKELRINKLIKVYNYLLTKEAQEKYKWIFIDSLTEISQNMIESLYLEFPSRRDSLVMYQENSKRMRSLIKSFRDLPYYNIIFTALSVIDKDENNRRFTNILLTGKISDLCPAFFDEVFYLNAVETINENKESVVKRYLITEKTDNILCKDRSGKLDKFEPADISLIMKKIRSQTNE